MSLSPFSSRNERISSTLNCKLSIIIPVIYGAVLSYSAYIFAEQVREVFLKSAYTEIFYVKFKSFLKFAILYILFTAYLLSDIGTIIKVESDHKFLTTTRYSFEMIIALLYVGIYSILPTLNIFIFFMFSLVLVLGGIWYNNFKEEYFDNEELVSFSRSQRAIHYVGALIVFIPFMFFIFYNNSKIISGLNLFIFSSLFLLWVYWSILKPMLNHRELIRKYTVNIFFPDKWFN